MSLIPNSKPIGKESNKEESFGKDTKFFKSTVAGLSVQIGEEPDRDEQPTTVRFVPYEFFDEEKGDHYVVGYLATDEQDAIEILADDVNVEEIDEKEFKDATENGKRAAY